MNLAPRLEPNTDADARCSASGLPGSPPSAIIPQLIASSDIPPVILRPTHAVVRRQRQEFGTSAVAPWVLGLRWGASF